MFGYEEFKEYEEILQERLLDNAVIIDNQEMQLIEQALPVEDIASVEFHQAKIKKKCYYCLEFIYASSLQAHVKSCIEQYEKILKESNEQSGFGEPFKKMIADQHKVKCKHCHHKYLPYLVKEHENKCFENQLRLEAKNFEELRIKNKKDQKKIKNSPFHGKICDWCQLQFPRQHQQIHEVTCETKEKIQSDLTKLQLSQVQFKAIWNMYEKSASQNQLFRKKMRKIVESNGYNQGDLMLMSEFIEYQAPICIHFNLSKSIYYFIRDTQYRNLFETNKSGGTSSTQSRKQWQSYLFGDFYNNCQPNQRVKYGVLNYANDKYGSKKCCKYGDSIMVLKDQVRKRCTIAHNRKYAPEERVATLKYNYTVLRKFSNDELSALYLASRGFEIDSSELKHFKEVHIHGSILFGRDIKCIYTSKQERDKNHVSVKIFQQRFGVKILTFEELEAEKVQ